MVLGVNGGVGHIFYDRPSDYVGYQGFSHLIRNYSTVTGAAFATRMSVVNELSGFDEQFRVDYNDVDFCLRAIEKGYQVVYTPYAHLFHYERSTVARNSPDSKETALFESRWSKYSCDPFYNPNLSRDPTNITPLPEGWR
jgi:GT2 family glycosyltransferase